jgi:hypothetical protein
MARNISNRKHLHIPLKPKRPVKSEGKSAKLTKRERMIVLLHRPAGASLADLVRSTGWQPHSVRGAISAVLRKRLGLNVVSLSDKHGMRVYKISPQGKRHGGKRSPGRG